jgi:hypothetical protein
MSSVFPLGADIDDADRHFRDVLNADIRCCALLPDRQPSARRRSPLLLRPGGDHPSAARLLNSET